MSTFYIKTASDPALAHPRLACLPDRTLSAPRRDGQASQCPCRKFGGRLRAVWSRGAQGRN